MTAVPCLICEQAADSKEHYIPQWLSKATGRPNEVIIRGAAVNGVVQSAQEHGTAIQAFEKDLCRQCNNGLGMILENRLDEAPKRGLLALLGELLAGRNPAPPADVHVHVARAIHPEVAFFLSKQLIDRTRGSVQAPGSFCWGMQAEHLILTVARTPSGARLAEGWGFGVWPVGSTKIPAYDDIRYYHARSLIETGLAPATHPPK